MNKEHDEIRLVFNTLRDPRTLRTRAHDLLHYAKQDQLRYFSVHPERLTATADFVIEVIQEQYPTLNIPYHSRWRHFEAGGKPRISKLLEQAGPLSADEQGKILYELVILSVFLDAGAGPSWRYKESETGIEYTRSEGLALASLSLYQKGYFSALPREPFRVDASRLIALSEEELSQGFQVNATNPLAGLSGRTALLNRLGTTLQEYKTYFGDEGRLGEFYTYVSSLKTKQRLTATHIFQAVLAAFNPIWPERLKFHGMALGDVGQHPALHTAILGSEYIPFHKLSQWLSYSLIEPLEQAGIQVADIDALTGLPEYRNGGLLLDMGLLQVKNKALLSEAQDPYSEFIVEWRALTVALLDELADLIRKKLHKTEQELPLAKILQGGTWEAGRRIAKQKRNEGSPPIQIISDGTVF